MIGKAAAPVSILHKTVCTRVPKRPSASQGERLFQERILITVLEHNVKKRLSGGERAPLKISSKITNTHRPPFEAVSHVELRLNYLQQGLQQAWL